RGRDRTGQGAMHGGCAVHVVGDEPDRPENISRTIRQDRTSCGAPPPALPRGGATPVLASPPTTETRHEQVGAGTGQKGPPRTAGAPPPRYPGGASPRSLYLHQRP